MIAHTDINEAEKFLKQFPEVEYIDLLIPDTNGIFLGKRIISKDLIKVYQQGICLPVSIFSMDITGNTVEASGLGFDIGEADEICRPVPGTLKPVTWKDQLAGQLLLTMYNQDGDLFYANPRSVLSQVTKKFASLKLTPVVAVEMEFYLLDKEMTQNEHPQPPTSPVTGKRETNTQTYSMENLDDYQGFLTEVAQVAQAQDIPASAAVSEAAPGQFEVNLYHQPNPLKACDNAILLKRIIKGVARKHGMESTFMAKPYMELSGNGMHIHLSLIDEKNENVFQGKDQKGSEMLQYAIGGLLTSMKESMAIFAPNANSYKRFQKDNYVPLSPNWGWNNRTTAIRIPAGSDDATRIEHRVAGADANPYLLMAVLLAGIHYGLQNKVKPFNYVTGNAYTQFEASLPNNWKEALAALEQGQILPDYLGEEYCEMYITCKTEEMEKFNRTISSLEYDWYLRTV